MKRIFLLAVLLSAGALGNPLFAQESADNELELVQRLRAKGWNDLARARIEDLLKRGDPALSAMLPYEMARIDIAEARQKDPEQRVALFTTARARLKDFIAKNQGKPLAAIASVELARVTSYHAEAILAKALREDTDAERHQAARPAEIMFIQAGKEIEDAVKSLESALKDAPPEMKARLEREYNQARFDIAINHFNQGRTVLDTMKFDDLAKRSAAIAKAKTEFEKLRKDESSQIGWLAVAWLMKCSIELDAPNDFKKYHDQVMKRRNDPSANPDIAPAVRLVRYFALQDLALRPKDAETIGRNELKVPFKSTKERLHKVQEDAGAWVKSYPNHLRSFEGEGVLYELAQSYLTEARNDENDGIKKVVNRLEKDKSLKGKGGAVEAALREGDFDKARTALETFAKDPANEKLAKQLKVLVDEGDTLKKITGPVYDKAIVALDKLADQDGDLAERARQMSMGIKFKRLDLKGELTSFADYYMKARIERNAVILTSNKLDEHAKKVADAAGDQAKLDALKDEKKAIEDERKRSLKDVIASLNKALVLATAKTSPKEIDDARYFLSGAYMAYGDTHRAAIVAEAIARARASRRDAESAGTAISTYAALSSRDPKNEVLRQRLFDMAKFVFAEPSWKTDSVTSTAHYHVAMALRVNEAIEEAENKAINAEEDKTKRKLNNDETARIKDAVYRANINEALTHLEQITPDFPDYIYVLGQIVFISEDARNKTEDKKEKKVLQDAARRAIARMPKLNAKNESSTVITMYFFAKLEQSKFMYSDAIEQLNGKEAIKAIKLCNDMKKYVLELRGEFDVLPGNAISLPNREQLDFTMSIMLKYADLGIAETKFRGDTKDRFDEVLAATKTVVDAMLKFPKEGEIKLKDYRVTGDILGLALRASVQKGDVPRGKEILDLLKRLTDPDGKQAGNVVGSLLNDIAGQIQRMKKDDPKGLDETKKNYTAFLDEIAKEYDQKYDPRSILMLGQAYKSLDYNARAATLFSKIKPPDHFDKVVKKPKDETDEQVKMRQAWEEEAARYCGVQIEYVRCLRLAKDKDSLAAGEKAAEALIANKNAKYTIQARMERNLIWEEQEQYRKAYIEWGAFLKIPALDGKNRNDPNVQKIYYPAYFYYTRTCFRMAVHDPNIKDRQKFINSSATLILNMENSKAKIGWEITGPMFKELLEHKDSKQLKDAYDKLRAAQPKGGSMNTPRPDGEEPARIAARSLALAVSNQAHLPIFSER